MTDISVYQAHVGDQGMYKGGLKGQNVLSVAQFDRKLIEEIFSFARDMEIIVKRFGSVKPLQGKVLTNLFYKPSTRTSSSFSAAMERLGGRVIAINGVHFSSVAKGESLHDTVRTLASYSDVIVLRHPETGAANRAAHTMNGFEFPVPIINAGDGTGEHPTQALLDIMTIREESGGVDGLHVVMVGDLKNGRTVHGLSRLLSLYDGMTLTYVSPDSLRMPQELLAFLREQNCVVHETTSFAEVIGQADVLYVTRINSSLTGVGMGYDYSDGLFVVNLKLMEQAKKHMILMHPFPRVGEIAYEVDNDPRAAYFRQMRNGMYMRMALLALVLGKVQ